MNEIGPTRIGDKDEKVEWKVVRNCIEKWFLEDSSSYIVPNKQIYVTIELYRQNERMSFLGHVIRMYKNKTGKKTD